MKLKLDLPLDRWNFVLQKLEPHKNDSETVTLFCLAIESLDFEISLILDVSNPLSISSGSNLLTELSG